MIELYLGGYKVDTTIDLEIPMTYEGIDFESPEAVKNNYSKTVKLQGTKNNNKVFGQIYRLDRNVIDSEDGFDKIGINFDANKRVEYYIKYEGSLYDRGYFKLDSIENQAGLITYNLTLYGGLGNFFYNLMYNDNIEGQEGQELNLGSLYYGLEYRSKEEENRVALFEYNAEFVQKCWDKRSSPSSFSYIASQTPKALDIMFCPIHTYGGYTPNFDADKVLINNELYPQSEVPYKLSVQEKDGDSTVTYQTKKGWSLIETPRKVTEDEIQDIRSHYQRLGIRLKSIYEAIKDPENNGGYTVDDSGIEDVQRAYLENGYLMLKQFDWEEINADFINTTIRPTWDLTPIYVSVGYNMSKCKKFDVSEYLEPNMQICLLPELKIYYGDNTALRDKYTTQGVGYGGSYSYHYSKNRNYYKNEYTVKSWFTYYFVIGEKNGSREFTSEIYIYGGTYGRRSDLQTKVEDYLLNKFKLTRGAVGSGPYTTTFNYTSGQADEDDEGIGRGTTLWRREEDQNEGGYTKWLGNYIKMQIPISKQTTQVKVYAGQLSYESFERFEGYGSGGRGSGADTSSTGGFVQGYPIITDSIVNLYVDRGNNNGILKPNGQTFSFTNTYLSDTEGFVTQIYDGDVALESDRHVLNKNAIFHDTPSPYQFLINLARMFNWKFISDDLTNKVYIYSSKNYYQNSVVDISDKLDFTKYTVIPSTAEHRYYQFAVEQDDTYAKKLWESKYNMTYGETKHKTRYEFSKDQHNILEDCEFGQVIPWKLSSVFFNRGIAGWPTPTLGNKYTVTLWKGTDTKEYKYTGYLSTTLVDRKINISQNAQDVSPKLCCFDSDYEPVDANNCLVFYDYLSYQNVDQNKVNYQLSDNIEVCKELNDNNCYYLCKGSEIYSSKYNTKKSKTSMMIGGRVPIFSNKFIYNNEIYFYSFKNEKNDLTLQNINYYGNGKLNNLYDLYFKDEYSDIYDKDAKIIRIKYRLTENPKEAMRHFYKFNNGIWLLNKIENYSPKHHNYVQCEFLKIKNVSDFVKR